MNPIFAAGLEVQRICEAAEFSFCFIGGLAVQRWGEPRMTADVDLTLLTGFGGEARYVDELLRVFQGRLTEALRTCSAEDLVVHKAFAAREKDWLDIRGIVSRQGSRLDRALVWEELRPLLELKDDPTIEERLTRVLRE
jgi:hypothetical protein